MIRRLWNRLLGRGHWVISGDARRFHAVFVPSKRARRRVTRALSAEWVELGHTAEDGVGRAYVSSAQLDMDDRNRGRA